MESDRAMRGRREDTFPFSFSLLRERQSDVEEGVSDYHTDY